MCDGCTSRVTEALEKAQGVSRVVVGVGVCKRDDVWCAATGGATSPLAQGLGSGTGRPQLLTNLRQVFVGRPSAPAPPRNTENRTEKTSG